MIYHLHRDAFSEVYTYRYRLTDADEKLALQATWPSIHATKRPERISFENAEERRLAWLTWQDRSWWRGDRFELCDLEGKLISLFEEHWNVVDRLLLHLPRYRITLPDGNALETRGSRYGECFYELFVLPADVSKEKTPEDAGMKLGEILHPPVGPTYIFKSDSPLLTTLPILVAAITIVVDLWGREKVKNA
jgi:hypothetical protein